MKASAKLGNLRISPRKVRLVTDLIAGSDTEDALDQLKMMNKRTSQHLEKLLKSAIANAENNFGLDRNNLYIQEIKVGEGTTLKRWMPRAYGRATPILKRTSKINIVLEEKVEGKNRKTKEQLEKERKIRDAEKKKLEKEASKKREEEGSEKKKEKDAPIKKEEFKSGGKTEKKTEKGWMKKMFQRKSG